MASCLFGSCNVGTSKQINGQWKVIHVSYSNPLDTLASLTQDYYSMKLMGRIIEFKADSVKWLQHGKFHFCTIDEEKREIDVQSMKIKIQKLTNEELILREQIGQAVVVTNYQRP